MKKEENNFIRDNDFSIRINVNNNKQLKYLPDSIFKIELPDLIMDKMANAALNISETEFNDDEYFLTITLRSTDDKAVEQEVFNILLNNNFNINISLKNPNITDFEFINCSISKIKYSPLIHRSKGNFFNFDIQIKIKQINIHLGETNITLGDVPVNYMSLAKAEGNKND